MFNGLVNAYDDTKPFTWLSYVVIFAPIKIIYHMRFIPL